MRCWHQIGLNVDIAPTIADLLGTVPPQESLVDGHSLAPLAFAATATTIAGAGGARGADADADASAEWRTAFLFEFWAGGKPGAAAPKGPYCSHYMMAVNNTYQGVRTASGLKYVVARQYLSVTCSGTFSHTLLLSHT
jgi:hypothetical protein